MSDIDVRLAQMAAQLDQEHARTADLRRDFARLAGERRKNEDRIAVLQGMLMKARQQVAELEPLAGRVEQLEDLLIAMVRRCHCVPDGIGYAGEPPWCDNCRDARRALYRLADAEERYPWHEDWRRS